MSAVIVNGQCVHKLINNFYDLYETCEFNPKTAQTLRRKFKKLFPYAEVEIIEGGYCGSISSPQPIFKNLLVEEEKLDKISNELSQERVRIRRNISKYTLSEHDDLKDVTDDSPLAKLKKVKRSKLKKPRKFKTAPRTVIIRPAFVSADEIDVDDF